MMHIVTLDWPSQKSSMNSREHWSKKAESQKAQKHAAAMLCRHLPKCEHKDDIGVTIIFCFPDRRRRDPDNLLSSIKLSLDAIAAQIDVDDSRFWPMTVDKEHGANQAGVRVFLNY
jgi:crossover junction endodeoxyribonuclease RusA